MSRQMWNEPQFGRLWSVGSVLWAVVVGVGLCWSSGQAWAQAWSQKQGNVYLKMSYGLSLASEQFNFEGRRGPFYNEKPGYTFADSSFYFYGEGGITDYLTLAASLPYKRLYNETVDHRKLTVGTGDMAIMLRLSIQELAKIPGISALAINVGASLPTGYTRNFLPALGRGQVELRATLNYGQSFYPTLPAYLQVGVGYQNRLPFYALTQATDCPSGGDINCIEDKPDQVEAAHELLVAVEFGLKPTPWLLMQFYFNGTLSLIEPKSTLRPPGEIPPSTQRFLKAGTALTFYPFYKIRGLQSLGFSAQIMGTLYGQNTINSADFMFGIEYQINFKKLGQ